MRPLVPLVAALVVFAACSSQEVQKAKTCSDPCCGGNSASLDCGESADVTCTESGDPCTAQAFGCSGGVFFRRPQASLPATCAADTGLDSTLESDATEPIEDAGFEAATDSGIEASIDGALDSASDAEPDAPGDGGADAASDGALDAP